MCSALAPRRNTTPDILGCTRTEQSRASFWQISRRHALVVGSLDSPHVLTRHVVLAGDLTGRHVRLDQPTASSSDRRATAAAGPPDCDASPSATPPPRRAARRGAPPSRIVPIVQRNTRACDADRTPSRPRVPCGTPPSHLWRRPCSASVVGRLRRLAGACRRMSSPRSRVCLPYAPTGAWLISESLATSPRSSPSSGWSSSAWFTPTPLIPGPARSAGR